MDSGLFYGATNDFKLYGFVDSDWGGDIDGKKRTSSSVFFLGIIVFSWS